MHFCKKEHDNTDYHHTSGQRLLTVTKDTDLDVVIYSDIKN